MNPLNFFGLGQRKAKKKWPYPPVSAHAPLSLQQLVDLTWTIGEPRELHRAGRRWTYDLGAIPGVASTGEIRHFTPGQVYQAPKASLSTTDIATLLRNQPQSFIPNDIGSMQGPS